MILDSAHFIFPKKRKGNAKHTYMNKRAFEDQVVILVEFGSKKVDKKNIKMKIAGRIFYSKFFIRLNFWNASMGKLFEGNIKKHNKTMKVDQNGHQFGWCSYHFYKKIVSCFMCQVRDHAILLNLGSLRAMAMQECVLIFDYNR